MAMPGGAAPGAPAPTRGNLLTNKLGPLPTWVWLGIGTLIIVGVALVMRKKSGSSSGQATPGQTAGAQQVPDIIIQNGGGRRSGGGGQTSTQTQPPPASTTTPPPASTTPPPGSTPPSNLPPGFFPVGNGLTGWDWTTPIPGVPTPQQAVAARNAAAATPAPAKSTPAKPKAQSFTTVTVGKWTASNTPWDSTLSGIASHFNVAGGYQALAKLNGISDPNLIHPGQKIKVPTG